MKQNTTTTVCLALLLIPALIAGAQSPETPQQVPERFKGRLADTGSAVPGPATAFFTLQINAYSTEQEIVNLLALLKDKGQDAVIDALWDMEEKGWIKIGNSLGYHAAVIRTFESEGTRIIRVLTDRPIQFVESMRGLRTRDYPFGIIELKIGPDGTGNGTLIAAAKTEFTDDGRVEIESYGTQPFKIMNIKAEKAKKK
jgi:hypothetical protein